MSLNFLEFEKPIVELEAKIQALRDVSRHGGDTSVDLEK
ncbi:acetyl-CoA carboxylase carboxyl transferase subunit alpha, partial [Vibrio fluvialis]|nr:acetyl-CoA carboxylase carboxyl transferase subunit alpha [Vibrio fluvialis]